MAFRVLIADALAKEGLEVFAKATDLEIVNRGGIKRDELLKIVGEFDALVVRSATEVAYDANRVGGCRALAVLGPVSPAASSNPTQAVRIMTSS